MRKVGGACIRKLGNTTECTNTAHHAVLWTKMDGGKGLVSKEHMAPKVGKREHCTAQDWSPKPQNSYKKLEMVSVYL